MNDEKKIAQAILDAQTMREESYEEPKQPIDDVMQVGDDGIVIQVGEYKLDMEECLIRTCRQNGLSGNIWCLLNLAMHWFNDIQLWAEDVLASKNILDECKRENAKMKDEMKRKGEVVDGLVDNDGAELSKQLTEMGDALKAQKQDDALNAQKQKDDLCCDSSSKQACEQCREIDSNGNLKGQIN